MINWATFVVGVLQWMWSVCCFVCTKAKSLAWVDRSLVHLPTTQELCLARTLLLQIVSSQKRRWKVCRGWVMILAMLLGVMTRCAPVTMQRLSKMPLSVQPLSSSASALVCEVNDYFIGSYKKNIFVAWLWVNELNYYNKFCIKNVFHWKH